METAQASSTEDITASLTAANINPVSYLATDYLNHFNEIIMLLEMIPDMPDIVEDCLEWRPKSYKQHFADSGFQGRDLAMQAYDMAPAEAREHFEYVKEHLDTHVTQTVNVLISLNVAERGLTGDAQAIIRSRVQQAQDMLTKMNQVINAQTSGSFKADFDDIFKAPVEDSGVQTQEEIDALFD